MTLRRIFFTLIMCFCEKLFAFSPFDSHLDVSEKDSKVQLKITSDSTPRNFERKSLHLSHASFLTLDLELHKTRSIMFDDTERNGYYFSLKFPQDLAKGTELVAALGAAVIEEIIPLGFLALKNNPHQNLSLRLFVSSYPLFDLTALPRYALNSSLQSIGFQALAFQSFTWKTTYNRATDLSLNETHEISGNLPQSGDKRLSLTPRWALKLLKSPKPNPYIFVPSSLSTLALELPLRAMVTNILSLNLISKMAYLSYQRHHDSVTHDGSRINLEVSLGHVPPCKRCLNFSISRESLRYSDSQDSSRETNSIHFDISIMN